MRRTVFMILFVTSAIFMGCETSQIDNTEDRPSDEAIQEEPGTSTGIDASYWYDGTAEITSYKLTQARYGELHEGTAVFVFVTEPFSPTSNTKANEPRPDNISVLKLNQTREFNTGIYPYNIMTSSFFPFKEGNHSMKVSSSIQEWCGHTYMEIRNTNSSFKVDLNSYYEGESMRDETTETALIEDDIWTMIRIRKELPQGKSSMYISMVAARLLHEEYKPYACELTLKKGITHCTYTIYYPELDRTLSIDYETQSPFSIIGWEETNYSGSGDSRKKTTTTAERMKTIHSAYWMRNSVADSTLRSQLNI